VANNQVVLQDDKSLNEVVVSNQKPNAAARKLEANKTLGRTRTVQMDGTTMILISVITSIYPKR
jgi:hypothetical protein